MDGVNYHKYKMKGAFECKIFLESWACAKKGGTAEYNFVPLRCQSLFFIKIFGGT